MAWDKELERYIARARSKEKSQEKENPKKPFWAALFGKREEKKTKEEIIDVGPTMAEDLRELARITLSVIKNLPEEKLITFKASRDFANLKEILKRQGIAK